MDESPRISFLREVILNHHMALFIMWSALLHLLTRRESVAVAWMSPAAARPRRGLHWTRSLAQHHLRLPTPRSTTARREASSSGGGGGGGSSGRGTGAVPYEGACVEIKGTGQRGVVVEKHGGLWRVALDGAAAGETVNKRATSLTVLDEAAAGAAWRPPPVDSGTGSKQARMPASPASVAGAEASPPPEAPVDFTLATLEAPEMHQRTSRWVWCVGEEGVRMGWQGGGLHCSRPLLRKGSGVRGRLPRAHTTGVRMKGVTMRSSLPLLLPTCSECIVGCGRDDPTR